ncbi:hypothetical protein [Sphingomonas hengshuiensis]|uniref:Uncharacterized protein n=1 Tax=Sphingomonas hengshuiensis TaxID=1609977 RepID=A0A7U4LG55_9SPHN|nr:hypothetical protein [Sphingomonas hengshuiensis]AJP72958.1 hypothetical protein TS85_15895 [Sphingomonas hengshuiensis]
MTQFAASTTVSASASRDEIERTLVRYGADQFLYGWQDEAAVVGFRMNGRKVQFTLAMPDRKDRRFTHHSRGERTAEAASKEWDQAVRQRWRALALVIKAKLEAIESGISLFEDEFLANIVLPTGETAGSWMRPQIAEAYRIGTMPDMLPMLPAPPKGTA